MIGCPTNLSGDELPDGHKWGDTTALDRPLPVKFVRLGDISSSLGVDATRWGGQ
jgi:hypothetical protein